MASLRLLVADDHTIVRQGLRKILEDQSGWTVTAQAGDGQEAVRQFLAHKPEVAILDIGMPILNGIEASRQIVSRVPSAKILMLSMYADIAYVSQAMRAGARGYLMKDSADEDLIRAVKAVAAGKGFLSPAIAEMIVDDYNRAGTSPSDPYQTLSEREREVLQLVVIGLSSKRIAGQLAISPTTVETHRARLMEKLDIHNVAELVLFAVRRGLVS